MSPKGRPTVDPKKLRFEIRLTENELDVLDSCADDLKTTKTDVIRKGIALVRIELDNKKE